MARKKKMRIEDATGGDAPAMPVNDLAGPEAAKLAEETFAPAPAIPFEESTYDGRPVFEPRTASELDAAKEHDELVYEREDVHATKEPDPFDAKFYEREDAHPSKEAADAFDPIPFDGPAGPEVVGKRLGAEPVDVSVAEDDGPKLSHRFDVDVRELAPSPTNPRKAIGDLSELAESVKRVGILQPLLARRAPTGNPDSVLRLELVFGHRRLEAAKLAGLERVPVEVRDMSDEEVIVAQITENAQRSDVHPMEEAEAYERLHKRGWTADKIAGEVGKSKAFVYGRMKLLELVPEARTSFFNGDLTASTALLVARIPAPMQAKALKEITRKDHLGEVMSYRAAAEHVQTHYMIELKRAPFDPKDDMLVPEAGPCSTCPRRTGNAPHLFGDVNRADVCTDPVCYGKKVEAHWELKSSELEAKGATLLTRTEGKKLFATGSLLWNAKYVELDKPNHEDAEKRTWKKLLGKELPQVFACQDGNGEIHELVLREEAIAILEKNGETKAAKSLARPERAKPKTKEEAEEDEREKRVKALVGAHVLDKATAVVSSRGLESPTLRMLCLALLDMVPGLRVLDRHEVKDTKAIEKTIEKTTEPKKLAALLFEIVMAEYLDGQEHGYTPELKAVATAFKIDWKAIDKDTRAAQKKAAEVEAANDLFKKGAKKASA